MYRKQVLEEIWGHIQFPNETWQFFYIIKREESGFHYTTLTQVPITRH